MGNIWITSDLHLCHDREFLYEPRGFSSIDEMNAAVVTNWNNSVAVEDDVYVLGDLMLNDDAAAAKILCWDRETLGLEPGLCGQNGSPTKVVRCYTSESGLRTPQRLFTPEEGKNAILERLAIG